MKTLLIVATLFLCGACGSNTTQFASPAYDASLMQKYKTTNQSYYHKSYTPRVRLENRNITYNTGQYPQYASVKINKTAYKNYHTRDSNYW